MGLWGNQLEYNNDNNNIFMCFWKLVEGNTGNGEKYSSINILVTATRCLINYSYVVIISFVILYVAVPKLLLHLSLFFCQLDKTIVQVIYDTIK